MSRAAEIRQWFDAQIATGCAAQPSDDVFPRKATVVRADAVPAATREAAAYYNEACSDWGGTSLHATEIAGGRIFFVHLGTDGDDGALEVFDANGTLIAAAFLDGYRAHWDDQAAVRARFTPAD